VSDGGSSITGYVIEIPGVYVDTVGSTTYTYRISGLTNGTPYTAQISAANANGAGELAYFRTVEPGNPPGPTQTQSFTRNANGDATFEWTAPASDGGATIGWNVVSCYPLDSSGAVIRRNVLGPETTLRIPDLSANTTYTALIRARNDPGFSPKAVYLAPVTFGPLPSDISGLKLWLDAADITTLFSDASGLVASAMETSQIVLWKDKSALSHDMSGAAIVSRIQNGLKAKYPSLLFTGNTLTNPSVSLTTHDRITIFMVAQLPTLASSQYFIDWNGNTINFWLDTSKGGDFLFRADGGYDNFTPFNGGFIVTTYTDAANVTTEILNPTYEIHSVARAGNSLNGSGAFTIGQSATNVRISELLIWDRVLSGAERGSIATYLQQKWGFLGLPTPVVYLVASDISGGDTTWPDRSGNGYNASLADGTSSKNGSNALVLDGASYWTFADIGLKPNFTMSTWFKRTDVIGSGGCIVTEAYTGGSYVNMAIFGGTYGASNTEFLGGFFDGAWEVGAPQEFAVDTWVQMSVSWDGTDVKTYLNGSLTDTTNYTGLSANTTSLGYRIGRRWDNPAYVTGDLGEVRIDSVALTAAQIEAYYNSTSANYSTPPPVPPTFSISYAESAPFYQGASFTLTATQTGGDAYTYSTDAWVVDTIPVATNTNGSYYLSGVNKIGITDISYNVTTTEFGTIGAANLLTPAIRPVIQVGPSTTVNAGDTVYFTVDLTYNADYQTDEWFLEGSSQATNTNGAWSYQFNSTGSFSVYYTYTNTIANTFYSATVTITVN
jgi:hypothetical protein